MKNLIFVFACLFSVSVFGQGACNNQSSVTHQGYEYDIVEIGDQCWFSENCRYLPVVYHPDESSETSPYYYVYGYEEGYDLAEADVASAQATTNYETYGVLYNWPAVMTEGICPSGWHIPSDDEFTDLTDFLGGQSVAGAKMKEAGYDHWNSPNTGATNSSGWTGLPGGLVNSNSSEVYIGGSLLGRWWTASEYGSNYSSWSRRLDYYDGDINEMDANRAVGFSARCVRDYSTTSSVPTEPSSNRKLDKVVDALGREVNHTTNQILFYIYDDGSVEKKFVVD